VQEAELHQVHLLLGEEVHDLLVLLVLIAHVALRHFLTQDLDMLLLILARRATRG
jgi:hypothetical protein